MRVPLRWLADHLAAPPPPAAEMAEPLSIGGLKVERILRHGLDGGDGNAERVVAGLVLEAGKHPNADRLQLCRVDTGEGEPRQIVCGAWNFGVGDTVAVALPGLVMPDGRRLERTRLRGETSDGMILSERELELSEEHGGILVLGDGFAPGEPLAARLALGDEVLELEVTSNRSDQLSMRGVAREVAAILGLRMAELRDDEPPARGARAAADVVGIAIDDLELCPRFTARVFEGVRIGPSPLWLKARLSAAGQRPISNIVDITNYVMHDLGNPLHAYDAARIRGGRLTARRARPGESLTTLDGKHRALDEQMLVIADEAGPSGIAGIMGGAQSEISDATTTVVLEAANFTRVQVLRTSQRLGLRTDGSNRWEKGVDPHLAPVASRAAARLVVELAGGAMSPDVIDVHGELPQRARLVLRPAEVRRITGMEIASGECERILDDLGFEPEAGPDGLAVRVPTWRWLDVTREIDVVEEVARMHLDDLPSTLPTGPAGGLSADQRLRRRLADALVGAGLGEAHTRSLVGPSQADRLGLPRDDRLREAVTLSNPLSAEHAQMRTLLLPSLLEAAARNVAVGRADVALFEVAHVYRPVVGRPLPDEPWTLAAVLCGRLGGERWRRPGPSCDFFVARGVLEAALAALGARLEVRPGPPHAFLHPGRSCAVLAAGEEIGFVGELHPLVAERFGLEAPSSCFELDLERLAAALPPLPSERPVSEFPPLRQDIAVVVSDAVAAADVLATAREAGGELLAGCDVFDVYAGAAIGEGHRSLGIRLTFQSPERTLSDEEVLPVRAGIVAALVERTGATLRGGAS